MKSVLYFRSYVKVHVLSVEGKSVVRSEFIPHDIVGEKVFVTVRP
jgi:hypothetical protein